MPKGDVIVMPKDEPTGRFPAMMLGLRESLGGLAARSEAAIEEIVRKQTATTELLERIAEETNKRYAEAQEYAGKMGI